ncbi:MAG: AAA family ATPase [Chloroflexi bacterium]|nr:AAA family ATPase [Chloroflexota bacterium]
MITLRRLAAAQYKGIRSLDLTFPDRGSFLIEGRNEAGKSTLFDGIYFALYGVPLVGDIASAIHYGADEAEVHLALDVTGTELLVRRRARQTAKTLRTEAELEVRRSDDVEIVKGARDVTQRLHQELGGLTSDALLNSCLVAQKQLGRLETLSRGSREEALTVLLNLSKLSDVQGKLRVKPEDEATFRLAQARVELARACEQLEALAARRSTLERLQRSIALQEGIARLRECQRSVDEQRAVQATSEQRLATTRQTLEQIERIKARREAWRHAGELARRVAADELAVANNERALAEARAAQAALPERRAVLERYRQARNHVLRLSAGEMQLTQIAAEVRQIERRLEERRKLADRSVRLDAEVSAMRRRRQELRDEIVKLAPLKGALDVSRARLSAFAALMSQLDQLDEYRRALEEVETKAADRAEAESLRDDARAALAAARATLTQHDEARRAAEVRRGQEQVRALLAEWLSLQQAIDAARNTQRLLDDLALGVAGVEHVGIAEAVRLGAAGVVAGQAAETAETAGLRLSLVVDHPLTGAKLLRLCLWSGGARLVEARPATEDEARGLQAGGLPSLSATGDESLQARLDEVQRALAAAGERAPSSGAVATARLNALDGQLSAPAAYSAYDGEAYVQARSAVAAAESRLTEADRACTALPSAAALARRVCEVQQQIATAERACTTAAARWQLPTADGEVLAKALPRLIEEEQRRRDDLAAGEGRRQGLQGELAALDSSGKQRADELMEYRANLATDSDEALLEALQRLVVEQESLVAEAARLRHTVEAVVGGTSPPNPLSDPERGNGGDGRLVLLTPVAIAKTGVGGNGRVANAPAALDVAALRDTVQRLVDEAGGAVAVLEDQAAVVGRLERELTAARERLDELREELHRAWDEVEESERWGDGGAQQAAALAAERVAVITLELQQLDEASVRAAEAEAHRAVGEAAGGVERTLQQSRVLAREMLHLASELGHDLAEAVLATETGHDLAEATVATGETAISGEQPDTLARLLLDRCPEASASVPPRHEIEAELRTLDLEAGAIEQRRQDAQATLGDEAPKPLAEAEAALADLKVQLEARRRAQDILNITRQRMINKVMPDTIRNMCLLIPLLTAGRYRFAELTPDYRLQVWDERKHGYVEKSLFSGGTQDQFSLALRLGFALAALPRELGTSPGFLFLDEPLSSFDRDRSAALVDLLTHGQIATFFQQVLLISHSQAFDPARFTHHIVMEDGQVVSSTLPVGSRQ